MGLMIMFWVAEQSKAIIKVGFSKICLQETSTSTDNALEFFLDIETGAKIEDICWILFDS